MGSGGPQECQEGSGGPLRGPVGVERPSQSSGRGREAFPYGRGMVKRPTQRAGSGREALQEGREWLVGHPGGVGRPSRRAGRGQEAHPVHLQGLARFWRPSQRAGRGQKALLQVCKRLEIPSESPQWSGVSLSGAGRGWESLRKGREQLGDPPERPGAVEGPS